MIWCEIIIFISHYFSLTSDHYIYVLIMTEIWYLIWIRQYFQSTLLLFRGLCPHLSGFHLSSPSIKNPPTRGIHNFWCNEIFVINEVTNNNACFPFSCGSHINCPSVPNFPIVLHHSLRSSPKHLPYLLIVTSRSSYFFDYGTLVLSIGNMVKGGGLSERPWKSVTWLMSFWSMEYI